MRLQPELLSGQGACVSASQGCSSAGVSQGIVLSNSVVFYCVLTSSNDLSQ